MIRSRRIGLAHATLALFAVAIIVQAARVQLVHGKGWREQAEKQQTIVRTAPAPRGEIFDATNHLLAESRELVHLEIAPREVNSPDSLRRSLARLHVDRAVIARAVDTDVKYVVVPGEQLAVDAAGVTALHGVHSTEVTRRAYIQSPGTEGLIGHVNVNNSPVDGLELTLDPVLRGTPGVTTIFKDWKGQVRESPIAPSTPPVRGSSVILTINADLQEIAEKSLADAVKRMGAEGGDIVILDPHSGDILAMASRRSDPGQLSATALTEPFEPGSTFKPFMAAALLERNRVSDADSVDTGNGVLHIEGRSNPISDEHLVGKASLADVLRWSSNVGIVLFSERLSEREQYETIRDFGFGTQTGLPYPAESPGTLRPPKEWSAQSTHSLAMGYEVAVTPLQLAAAYAVFANGGELVEPALVKEIVDPNGVVKYHHERRVVRRVISQRVADKVRRMLLNVVDEGTAVNAAMDNYQLAGKTGTPRGTVRGRYVPGRYNPNFVGLFPGDAPQYVIVVKMTAPHSSIFAAETAAPVSKIILQTALAARDAALDRDKLATSMLPMRPSPAQLADTAPVTPQATALPASPAPASAADREDPAANTATVPIVVTLPAPRPTHAVAALRPIPDVRDLDIRAAVRSLHDAGFRVDVGSLGAADFAPASAAHAATIPAAGQLAKTGSIVRLIYNH